jgi:hypothetical protein
MSLEFLPRTEIEMQRSAWFAEHAKPGTPMDEFIRLNDEALRLFPPSQEERRLKTESLKAMPEFVL